VILVYPLLLVVFARVARARSATVAGGRGWPWFAAWAASGVLFLFSLATGFSIGLFLLPLVTIVGVVVARASPRRDEALGFACGAVAVVAFLLWLNGAAPAGAVAIALAAAVAGLYALRRRAEGATPAGRRT
jgi:EamA domain-containing membrane protein RarD